MSYASKFGRAKVNSRNPQAFAICDRCGFGFNHVDLRSQMDYAGAALINKRILVCNSCYDTPNEQLRAIILPADPMPIMNPRVPDFQRAETNQRVASAPYATNTRTGIPVPGGATRVTEDGQTRATQQTGEPPSGLNQRPGTDPNAPGNANPGLPLDNVTIPETGPLK
jgi:hypothetical protein